jgi:hypothetical protein
MNQWWSWILAVIGVSGIYVVGNKNMLGWLVLCINECIWILYALATKQYGFIIMALAYASVYIKSFRQWRAEEK